MVSPHASSQDTIASCLWLPSVFNCLLSTSSTLSVFEHTQTLLPLKYLENKALFKHMSQMPFSLCKRSYLNFILNSLSAPPHPSSALILLQFYLSGSMKVIDDFLSVKSNRYLSLLILFDLLMTTPVLLEILWFLSNLILNPISTFCPDILRQHFEPSQQLFIPIPTVMNQTCRCGHILMLVTIFKKIWWQSRAIEEEIGRGKEREGERW